MRKSIHSSQYRLLLELLLTARSRAGLTQIQLANRLRITQSSVSKVERGERRLDVIELHQWCVALRLPFIEFARQLDDRIRGTESRR